MAKRYSVQTWCGASGRFTPQDDVPAVVEGFAGLRRAIQLLRDCGYTAHRSGADRVNNDSAVLIEAIEEGTR